MFPLKVMIITILPRKITRVTRLQDKRKQEHQNFYFYKEKKITRYWASQSKLVNYRPMIQIGWGHPNFCGMRHAAILPDPNTWERDILRCTKEDAKIVVGWSCLDIRMEPYPGVPLAIAPQLNPCYSHTSRICMFCHVPNLAP